MGAVLSTWEGGDCTENISRIFHNRRVRHFGDGEHAQTPSRREKGEEEEACVDIIGKRILAVHPDTRYTITSLSYTEEGDQRTRR